MKTLHQYLAESKKDYNFVVKIAGSLPDDFEGTLKSKLEQFHVLSFVKTTTTPIQKQPIDFPNKSNCEVHVFAITCDYPVIPPEIAYRIKASGVDESSIRVHNAEDPSLDYIPVGDQVPSGNALLTDPAYKDAPLIAGKDHYGADYNKGFLKGLAAQAKDRKKDGQNVEYKITKQKTDKTGLNSAIGS
jgi:hypothetical protein